METTLQFEAFAGLAALGDRTCTAPLDHRLAIASLRLGSRDVRCTRVDEGHALPLCVTPLNGALRTDPAAFVAWYRARLDLIDELLDTFGAILWRGFAVPDTAAFGRLGALYPPHAHGYTAGAAPRKAVADQVYESTRMPAPFKIGLHQEKAYMASFPRLLAFYCRQPAAAGGETPLCDMRAVTARLAPAVRARFAEHGVMYRRNFVAASASGLLRNGPNAPFAEYHRPWHEAFETTRRDEVEALCRQRALQYEWLADGSLTVSHTGPALLVHPRTGEAVWFNQASAQHPNARSMGKLSFRYLERVYRDRAAFPYEVRYGNGAPVAPAHLEPVYDAVDAEERAFGWQAGDLLVLDNMLVAHGRNPFKGERDTQVMLFD
jgi:alpha-ketoglutarate-dependent taurine dioxygenase